MALLAFVGLLLCLRPEATQSGCDVGQVVQPLVDEATLAGDAGYQLLQRGMSLNALAADPPENSTNHSANATNSTGATSATDSTVAADVSAATTTVVADVSAATTTVVADVSAPTTTAAATTAMSVSTAMDASNASEVADGGDVSAGSNGSAMNASNVSIVSSPGAGNVTGSNSSADVTTAVPKAAQAPGDVTAAAPVVAQAPGDSGVNWNPWNFNNATEAPRAQEQPGEQPGGQESNGFFEYIWDMVYRMSGRRRRATPRGFTPSDEHKAIMLMMEDALEGESPAVDCWEKKHTHELQFASANGTGRMVLWLCTCPSCKTTPGTPSFAPPALLQANAVLHGNRSAHGNEERGAGAEGAIALADPVNSNPWGWGSSNSWGWGAGASTTIAKACMLAIGGTNSLLDFTKNGDPLADVTTSFCGRANWYKLFVDELNTMTGSSEWDTIKSEIAHCDRLVTAGHGMGGALATIFATCVNSDATSKPAAFDGITTEVELYTAAAPRVRQEMPENDKADDKAFKGLRMYSYSTGLCLSPSCLDWCCASGSPFIPEAVDPVPCELAANWNHPKIHTIGLDIIRNEVSVDLPADADAKRTPTWTYFAPGWMAALQIYQHALDPAATSSATWEDIMRNLLPLYGGANSTLRWW